jgi:hypothetical protein
MKFSYLTTQSSSRDVPDTRLERQTLQIMFVLVLITQANKLGDNRGVLIAPSSGV